MIQIYHILDTDYGSAYGILPFKVTLVQWISQSSLLPNTILLSMKNSNIRPQANE